jgi:hypothetical protein
MESVPLRASMTAPAQARGRHARPSPIRSVPPRPYPVAGAPARSSVVRGGGGAQLAAWAVGALWAGARRLAVGSPCCSADAVLRGSRHLSSTTAQACPVSSESATHREPAGESAHTPTCLPWLGQDSAAVGAVSRYCRTLLEPGCVPRLLGRARSPRNARCDPVKTFKVRVVAATAAGARSAESPTFQLGRAPSF